MRLLVPILLAVLVAVLFLLSGRETDLDRDTAHGALAPLPAVEAGASELASSTPYTVDRRRAVEGMRRVRVELAGGHGAPIQLLVFVEGGSLLRLEDDGDQVWDVGTERAILAASAPGFTGDMMAALEGDAQVTLRLEAFGEVHMLAADANGAPTEGVLAFLTLPFEGDERGAAQRKLRFGEARSLFEGTLEPELFDVTFEGLREHPFDALDRALAAAGERELYRMTDSYGRMVWGGIPPLEGMTIELDTDCRCEDVEGNPALSKTSLSQGELFVRRVEERRSAPFDLAPGGLVERGFRCERSAVVRGRFAPFPPGAEGVFAVQNVRTDIEVDGASVVSLNEKHRYIEADGSFAAVVKPGRKRVIASWSAGDCSFSIGHEVHLAPGGDLDLGTLTPPKDASSITVRPVLVDEVGNELAWEDHAAGVAPTVLVQYRVVRHGRALGDPDGGSTAVQQASCRIGEAIGLCGLPGGELELTTLLDWGPTGPPRGLRLRRGAGKLQRTPLRAGDSGEVRVPFVTEASYHATIVVHNDAAVRPRAGASVSGRLLRFGGESSITMVGRLDAAGALTFEVEAPAGNYAFYAQLPGTDSASGFGIHALASVVVGQAQRVETVWSHGTRVEVGSDEDGWDPASEPVELLLRTDAGDMSVAVLKASELDGVPPGSGIELPRSKRGYFLPPDAPTVSIPLDG
ncbi:MAG: hypothetical protein AAF682_02120 [Planctomycetota bacterium]